MDLFEYMRENFSEDDSPLAKRMRPTSLDDVVGQEHIIGKDKLLYRAIKADKISSLIFYGPPGTGKTTLAMVIANTTKAEFRQLNATTAGKKDMEKVVEEAKNTKVMYGRRTILFIDEIHRFNKSQQDYLLPFVEDGTVVLIGATTENPYFEVNGALNPDPIYSSSIHYPGRTSRSSSTRQCTQKMAWVHLMQTLMRRPRTFLQTWRREMREVR